MPQGGAAALGAVIGATLTLGLTLLPKLLRRGNTKRTATTAPPAAAQQQQPAVAQRRGKQLQEPQPLFDKAFGSPVEAKNASKGSSRGPGTPSASKTPHQLDTVATKDQALTAADAAAIQQQLQQLKAVEEENKRLKDFMERHVQASEKVKSLEEENEVLKQVQTKLQGELEEFKQRTTTTPFALSSGDELQSFKQMLATRMPLEARSVCSDALQGLGRPRDTSASVDGAATVADIAAVRKRAPGFFSELASLLLMAPSPKQDGRGRATQASCAPSGLNTPRSTYGGSVLGASSPVPSRQASMAPPPAMQPAVDVGQLLETWAGGRL